ncbi:MAG: hypothetical protein JXM79_07095 [Sedimentisphaerales bacterium]|nr:hypothetical protein [Sedimentisphaerales bacterium]
MWRSNVARLLITIMVVACYFAESSPSQPTSADRGDYAPSATLPETASSHTSRQQRPHPLYPNVLEKQPTIPSPYVTEQGMEILTAMLKNGKHVFIPATIENGKPLHYSHRVSSVYGKDQQLHVNRGDFPALARTGLHAEAELDGKERIWGLPVEVITYIGRPGRFSGAGFMANDEDILSVLKGDNALVQTLGLTHPQMARPVYHVWNMLLQEIEAGALKRFSNIQYFLYNGNKVTLRAESMKGWQTSIFQDEIQGRFDIDVQRTLTDAERLFLQEKYAHLSVAQMTQLQEKLTRFHFSEMVPYYIMRYGFYEGHTDYRADPIAIACIFGLKSVEEIENAFPGRLYKTLVNHFTK